MKTFRIHYPQINELWIEVEASSPEAALNKANREIKEYVPTADTFEYPTGEQRNLEDSPLL